MRIKEKERNPWVWCEEHLCAGPSSPSVNSGVPKRVALCTTKVCSPLTHRWSKSSVTWVWGRACPIQEGLRLVTHQPTAPHMAPALMLGCAPSFPTASQVLVAWCGLHRLRTPAPSTVPSPQLALVSADCMYALMSVPAHCTDAQGPQASCGGHRTGWWQSFVASSLCSTAKSLKFVFTLERFN